MWGELTMEQWKQIENSTDLKHIASVLSGLDVNEALLNQLLPFMFFMQTPFEPEDWKLPPSITIEGVEIRINIDIKNETFGQKLLLQEQVKPNEIEKAIAIYLQPAFSGEEFDYNKALAMIPLINKLKLCEIYPVANFFFSQLKKLIELEQSELSNPTTDEQRRAGIDMFSQFGSQNIIDSLAHGDILKYEQIVKLNYNLVFLKLKRTKLEVKFKKNYEKIIRSKNQ
jgi:hypothetical protein